MKRFGTVMLALIALIGVVFAEAPWDFLRPAATAAADIGWVVAWIVMFVSAVMAYVAFAAYLKHKMPKLLWVMVAFGLFFVKSALHLADLYISPGTFMNVYIQSVFDLAIMSSLFVSLFKK
ncbi:MAG: hypothetical protein AABW59_03260 [archaeon]